MEPITRKQWVILWALPVLFMALVAGGTAWQRVPQPAVTKQEKPVSATGDFFRDDELAVRKSTFKRGNKMALADAYEVTGAGSVGWDGTYTDTGELDDDGLGFHLYKKDSTHYLVLAPGYPAASNPDNIIGQLMPYNGVSGASAYYGFVNGIWTNSDFNGASPAPTVTAVSSGPSVDTGNAEAATEDGEAVIMIPLNISGDIPTGAIYGFNIRINGKLIPSRDVQIMKIDGKYYIKIVPYVPIYEDDVIEGSYDGDNGNIYDDSGNGLETISWFGILNSVVLPQPNRQRPLVYFNGMHHVQKQDAGLTYTPPTPQLWDYQPKTVEQGLNTLAQMLSSTRNANVVPQVPSTTALIATGRDSLTVDAKFATVWNVIINEGVTALGIKSASLSGVPNGTLLIVRIDTLETSCALTWNSTFFRASAGKTLPTTTVSGVTYLHFRLWKYTSSAKWELV